MMKSLDSPKNLRKISVPSVDGNSSDDEDTSDVSSSYASMSTARRNWDFSGSIKDVRPVAPRRRSNSVIKAISCSPYIEVFTSPK